MDSDFRLQVWRSTSFRHALHVIKNTWRPFIKGGLGVNLQNPGHEAVFGA
jgi:hypothetical protein